MGSTPSQDPSRWPGIGRPAGPDFVAGERPDPAPASTPERTWWMPPPAQVRAPSAQPPAPSQATPPSQPAQPSQPVPVAEPAEAVRPADSRRPDYAWFTPASRPAPRAGASSAAAPATGSASGGSRRGRRWGIPLLVLAAALLGGGAGGLAVHWLAPDPEETTQLPVAAAPGSTAPAAPGTSEAAAAAVVQSVVQVMAAGSTGSGFVYDARGHVITNHHVVAGRSSVRLQLHDGRTVAAQVVGTSAIDDIAVLRAAEPGQLTRAQIGRSGELRIGQPVIAVGSPLGLSGTVTAGIVSSVDRQAAISGSPQRFVQTDAPINPGNSGGPLVDLDGRVVGVNTAIATVSGRSSGSIGIGFAVPMERAQQVANRLIRGG